MVDNMNSEIIDRTINQIMYNPNGEMSQRRQYMITLDVWNFNIFW